MKFCQFPLTVKMWSEKVKDLVFIKVSILNIKSTLSISEKLHVFMYITRALVPLMSSGLY